MDTTPRDLDALLAQAGWAKALAQSLVRDADRADDLVQRAWLAALRNPPDGAIPPRRWLAAVIRNLVRDDAREASSRARREREVARPERAPDPFDDAASAQARLLAAVRELPEPNRSAVWARYYEGLAPRAIAQRDGVPVETVKTRIARGLDALRKRFDREHGGDRDAWIAAFAPLAFGPVVPSTIGAGTPSPASPFVTTTLTTLAMDAKLKIAAVLAVVLCGTGIWLAARDGDVSPVSAGVEPSAAFAMTAPSARPEPNAPLETDAPRVAIAKETAPAVAPAAKLVEYRHGVVLDLDRRPVAGVAILESWPGEPLLDGDVPVVSDARGRFRVEAPRAYVAARGNGWISLFSKMGLLASAEDELCVVVARERRWTGTVVDAAGAPVAGAIVDLNVAESLRTSFGEILRRTVDVAFGTRCDEHGRFDLGPAPDVDGRLVGRADNHRPGATPIAAGALEDVVVVLPAPDPESVVLRGRVVDAAGAGAADATVIVVGATVTTAGDGRFELPVTKAAIDEAQRTTTEPRPPTRPTPVVLRAAKIGHLPAEIVLQELEELERSAATTDLRLVLGGPPLALAGRVVDSRGEPVANARINVLDEQPFGRFEVPQDGITYIDERTVEQFLRGQGAPPVMSGADGRFTIEGLQPREYRLDVLANRIPAARITAPISAGATEVEIVLKTDGPRADVAGRVVDKSGAGVAGARVVAFVVLDGYEELVSGPSETTDADGRFALPQVHGRTTQMEVFAAQVIPERTALAPDAKLGEIVLVVSRRAFVQVDLGDRRDLANAARFLDAGGRDVELDLSRTIVGESNSTSISWRSGKLEIANGRSQVGGAPQGAYVCVLEKDGAEVARIPVRLGGADVTIVRP